MIHRMGVGVVTGTVLLIVSVGCHESNGASNSWSRDSLGVRISMTDLRDASRMPSCVLGTSPTVQIGAVMGDTAQELASVSDARRLGDGRIVVLDRGRDNVRVFDATGRLLASFGRQGSGPGEFRFPGRLELLAGDSLAVWDLNLRRITVLDASGGPAREVSFSVSPAYPTNQFAVLDGDFLVGSRLYQPPKGAEFVPQSLLVLRYSPDGTLLDTLSVLPNGKTGWIRAGDFAMVGQPAFGSRALFGSNGTLLYMTAALEPSVEALDSAGRVVASVRWIPPDRTVTEADLRAYRERLLRGPDPATEKQNRLWLDATPVAKTFPAADAILAGTHGDIWVKRYHRPSADSTVWWSFARDGHFQCRLALADPFTALQFGEGWVLGVRTGKLDVEYVQLWPVTVD